MQDSNKFEEAYNENALQELWKNYEDALNYEISRKNFSTLQGMIDVKLPCGLADQKIYLFHKILRTASKYGDLDILEWFWEKKPFIFTHFSYQIKDCWRVALRYGHLDILKFLFNLKIETIYVSKANIRRVVLSGYIDILNWMWSPDVIGPKYPNMETLFDACDFNFLIQNGKLESIKWLIEVPKFPLEEEYARKFWRSYLSSSINDMEWDHIGKRWFGYKISKKEILYYTMYSENVKKHIFVLFLCLNRKMGYNGNKDVNILLTKRIIKSIFFW